MSTDQGDIYLRRRPARGRVSPDQQHISPHQRYLPLQAIGITNYERPWHGLCIDTLIFFVLFFKYLSVDSVYLYVPLTSNIQPFTNGFPRADIHELLDCGNLSK